MIPSISPFLFSTSLIIAVTAPRSLPILYKKTEIGSSRESLLTASPRSRQTLFLKSFHPYNSAPSLLQFPSTLALHKVIRLSNADKATRNFRRDQRVRAGGKARRAHGARFEGGVDVGVFQHVIDGGAARREREQFGELFRREVARFCERVGFCVRVSGKLA